MYTVGHQIFITFNTLVLSLFFKRFAFKYFILLSQKSDTINNKRNSYLCDIKTCISFQEQITGFMKTLIAGELKTEVPDLESDLN